MARRKNSRHGSYPEVEKAIRSANRYARQYNKLMRESLDQYGSHGSTVSGVGRSHFPASVKSKLRELLKKYNAKQDEAAAEFKFYHPRTDFYRSKRSAHLRDMMVKAGFYGTGRRNPRSTRYAFKSVRGGDYGGSSKAQLLKNVRANLKRIATEKERSHAVEQLQHLKAARLLTSAEFWKLVDVADSALDKAGRKKSNPRNRKLDIELPNTNLTVVGAGRDTNGNSVIRFKTPNQRAFSIQTVGKPALNRAKQALMAGEGDREVLSQTFIRAVVKYIKAHGSPAQKKSLRTYGRMQSNPKRRRNSRVLWRRNKWRIEWYDPQAKWRGFYVVGENHAEHPTVYFDGSIAYDRPELVPQYVQKAVAQLARKYESQMDAYNNPKRRKNVNAEIFSTYARGRRAKFGASDDPMRFASGPFSPQFKRVRRNSKASRSNLVFFMETGRGKRNIKVYKVGKKYEMVVHEKGQPDLTAQTTSKAELKAVVGQFHRVGYMTGEAKYKVKHDALGLGIE